MEPEVKNGNLDGMCEGRAVNVGASSGIPSVARKYLDYIYSVRRYSARTCDIYSGVIVSFCRFAIPDSLTDGGLVEALIPQVLRGYEMFLMKDGKSARTVNLHMSVLSSMCSFLVKEGVLESNPVKLVKRPKQEKRLPSFFREEDVAAYFERTAPFASGLPDITEDSYARRLGRAVISTLYNTGIRRSELAGLSRGDVDFSRKVMRVLGKGDKMREIPLLPSYCEEISLYLQTVDKIVEGEHTAKSPLFLTFRGRPLYPVLIDRIVKRELGVSSGFSGRKSPHVLRHTIATELLENGADLNSIKEFLGHSSLAATQVYTHNTIGKLKSIYESAHPRAKNGGKNGD